MSGIQKVEDTSEKNQKLVRLDSAIKDTIIEGIWV